MKSKSQFGLAFALALLACAVTAVAQQGASKQEFQEAKRELGRKVKSPSPEVRADACKVLARFDGKTAAGMIIEAMEVAEADVQKLMSDRANLYKRWEEVKLDWTIIEKDQKQRIQKYRAAQRQFADHYELYMRHMRAKGDIVAALGGIEDPVAVNLFAKRLRTHRSKRAWVLRSIVSEAFAKVQSPVVLETLTDMVNKKTASSAYDPRIAVRAIYALAGQADMGAEKAIITAAKSAEDWQVRAAAIDAIGQNRMLLAKPTLEEIIKTETGRLRKDALVALHKVDPRGRYDYDDELADVAYPCLDLECHSRNVMFVISAGYSMSKLWDTSADPVVDPAENVTRFEIAKEGVKDYLRTIVSDMEALEDPKKELIPFRFNVCIYRGYSEFFEKEMVEVTSISQIYKIEDAIRWLDWDSTGQERRAVGEANLVEALDKCFNLVGFGSQYDAVNIERQPDTMILMMDITPDAGAFRYTGDEEDKKKAKADAWVNIKELVDVLDQYRQVQLSTIGIGTDAVTIVRDLKGLSARTGGGYLDYTPSSATNRIKARERARERQSRRERD